MLPVYRTLAFPGVYSEALPHVGRHVHQIVHEADRWDEVYIKATHVYI